MENELEYLTIKIPLRLVTPELLQILDTQFMGTIPAHDRAVVEQPIRRQLFGLVQEVPQLAGISWPGTGVSARR